MDFSNMEVTIDHIADAGAKIKAYATVTFDGMFKVHALFPNLNAYENITYGLRNKPNISSKEEVDDLIKLLSVHVHDH